MNCVDCDIQVYIRPDPVKVAQVWDDCVAENACERWGWVTQHTLAKIAQEGRAPARRSDASYVRRTIHNGVRRATPHRGRGAA